MSKHSQQKTEVARLKKQDQSISGLQEIHFMLFLTCFSSSSSSYFFGHTVWLIGFQFLPPVIVLRPWESKYQILTTRQSRISQEAHFKNKDPDRLEVNGCEKIYHTNTNNPKEPGVRNSLAVQWLRNLMCYINSRQR